LKSAPSASAPNSRGRTWELPPGRWRPRRAPPSARSRSPLNSPPSSPGNDAAPASRALTDYVFATRLGTPLGQRNVARTALAHAVKRSRLDGRGRPPLRFHDLRHTFASHLIVDLRLDVCQVSRILGHARTAITLDVYTHLFDRARHAADIRAAMAESRFGQILAEATATAPSPKEDARTRGRIVRAGRAQHPTARPGRPLPDA
jgi:Phage integrase family